MPSVQKELEERRENLLASPTDYEQMEELLKFLDEKKISDAEATYKYGSALIENRRSALGTRLWRVVEQTFLAALCLGELDQSLVYLDMMNKKFPDSNRVLCFQGMLLEANASDAARKSPEEYKALIKEALFKYQEVLGASPNDQMALKRCVCLELVQGQTDNAITKLNKYLTLYHNDAEAWKQLAQLHLKQHNYKLALFALEELVLTDPSNYTYHTMCAEALYALGGEDNVGKARRHYAMSITRNPDANNMRALLGYVLCCEQLGPSDAEGLESRVVDRIREAYNEAGNKAALQFLDGVLAGVQNVD